MASITRLVNSFDVNSKEFVSVVHDLMIDNKDVPFDNHEVNTVQNAFVKSVNSCINQAGCDFLPILDRILPTCSKDTFTKYGLFWIVNTTKVLENVHSSIQDLILACKVLGVLVEQCKEIPDLHKQISMQHVKQLINVLSTLQPDAKCGAVYYLIAVLLYHYSEVCDRFQELIKKIILLQIDSTQKNLVNASARCYVLLSKVTERSFKPPPSKSIYTAITYNEVLLCNNLHAIMDELFSGLIELESVDIWDQLELPPISNKDVLHWYEARNSVLPRDILGVLCRGLAITPLNLMNKTSFKEQRLYIILPKLHISLLTVLDAFINGFAQELVPYGAIILQLFQQTLQWTSFISENQMTFRDSKPFKNVRIHTYKCLCSWLINMGASSGIETIENEFITDILKDVTPERECILLSLQPKHSSKRAIKHFKRSQYENSAIMNNGESSITTKKGSLYKDLCKEALITLQYMIYSGSVLVKQTFYKSVQNTVIPLLYNVYLGAAEQNFYKDHNICRLELFKVLKALQMNPHVTLVCPIQYYLEISHMATLDTDLSIAQEAKLTLAQLEKIIHPIAPTLQLPRQREYDELVPEIQIKDATTSNEIEETTNSTSDKRSRAEEESFQDADAIPSIHKRPRIIAIETIQKEMITELTEKNNDMNINKSQADDNSCRPNVIHVDSIQTETVEELNKTQNKKQNQLHIDTIPNAIIESRVECELDMHITTKEQEPHEQAEDSKSPIDKRNKRVEQNPKIIGKKASPDYINEWEEMDDEVLNSLSLFHDEIKSSND
ncbi:PREDICTED: proline-, glutamic acid- and leucine-rich protein 1-like [Cyphomyrmex costatus]|uniref:proline-, glutamic acid- and leucine-rich protein 1-like n=1 Tax=Cyphomyrmex costatus TaxID=456900 RepID=UPI00085240F6|nr:PREDICTED: proline-, glutamic acid- and leucine-rich protein 1-like [Cyphomyrmex costatus]